MPLSDVADIQVSRSGPTVTRAGFGTDLLVSGSVAWTERWRKYASLSELDDDFATTTPEYLFGAAYFGQKFKPPSLIVGRGTKPTMVQVVGVTLVANSTAYVVRCFSAGVLQTATYTSDSSATNDEIATGVAAAITALAAPDIGATAAATGSVGSKVCTVTGDAAGNWFSVEIMDPLLLYQEDTTADAGIAADLAAIQDENDEWYGVSLLFKGAQVAAAATWVEAETKIMDVAISDTKAATVAYSSGSDVMHTLAAASRLRTRQFFHQRQYDFTDAGEFGRFFPISPGGDNWTHKTLSGPTPGWGATGKALTSTQITNIEARKGGYYYVLGGLSVIGGHGLMAGNEYVDVIRGIDWYTVRLGERLANLEIQSEKIEYDDAGVAKIEAQVRAQNDEGIAAKLIARDPEPTVSAPKVADIAVAAKQLRELPDVTSAWTLAGAINKATVRVAVTA